MNIDISRLLPYKRTESIIGTVSSPLLNIFSKNGEESETYYRSHSEQILKSIKDRFGPGGSEWEHITDLKLNKEIRRLIALCDSSYKKLGKENGDAVCKELFFYYTQMEKILSKTRISVDKIGNNKEFCRKSIECQEFIRNFLNVEHYKM